MNRIHVAWVLACAVSVGVAPAHAQVGMYNRPQVNPRPTISPYLNIMRGNPAVNYFGIVRPQIEMGRQLQQLQYDVQQYQPNIVTPLDPQAQTITGLTTGHGVSFQNLSHFYAGRGTTGGVAGGAGNPQGYPNLSAMPIRPVFTPTVTPQP